MARILIAFKNFIKLSAIEKKLFFYGIVITLTVLFLNRIVPLKKFIKFLDLKPDNYNINLKSYYIRLVKKTLHRIERFFPIKLSCLIKSVVFKYLLNNLGIHSRVELGIHRSESDFKAHAYVTINDQVVYLGLKKYHRLTVLA